MGNQVLKDYVVDESSFVDGGRYLKWKVMSCNIKLLNVVTKKVYCLHLKNNTALQLYFLKYGSGYHSSRSTELVTIFLFKKKALETLKNSFLQNEILNNLHRDARNLQKLR
jgi:hypothetical protein